MLLKLKTPWRDGTTHLLMSSLGFMQRLAALVLQPVFASREVRPVHRTSGCVRQGNSGQ